MRGWQPLLNNNLTTLTNTTTTILRTLTNTTTFIVLTTCWGSRHSLHFRPDTEDNRGSRVSEPTRNSKNQVFFKNYAYTPSSFLPLVPSFWSRSQCRVLYHCLKLLTSVFNSVSFFFTFWDLFVCDKDAKGMISVSQTLFWKAKIIIGTAKKLQNLNRHQ